MIDKAGTPPAYDQSLLCVPFSFFPSLPWRRKTCLYSWASTSLVCLVMPSLIDFHLFFNSLHQGPNGQDLQQGVVPNSASAEELATAQFNAAKKEAATTTTESRGSFFRRRRPTHRRSKSLGRVSLKFKMCLLCHCQIWCVKPRFGPCPTGQDRFSSCFILFLALSSRSLKEDRDPYTFINLLKGRYIREEKELNEFPGFEETGVR